MNLINLSIYTSASGLSLLIPGIVILYWYRALSLRKKEMHAFLQAYGLTKFIAETTSKENEKCGDDGTDPISAFFGNRFSAVDYVWPCLFFLFVVSIGTFGTAYCLAALKCDNTKLLLYAPPIFTSFFGAYIFCLLEVVYRYTRSDLLPSTVLKLTSYLIVGSVLGIVLTPVFNEKLWPTMTTAVGLSVPLALDSLKQRLAQTLGVRLPAEQESDLKLLFPSNSKLISRLSEEGVESLADLAKSDPLRLYLVLPYELNVILSWVDRANLAIYFPNKIATLRESFQIIGIVDLASITQMFGASENNKDIFPSTSLNELIAQIAIALEISTEALLNCLDTFYTDPQVDRIWRMYGALYNKPKKSKE